MPTPEEPCSEVCGSQTTWFNAKSIVPAKPLTFDALFSPFIGTIAEGFKHWLSKETFATSGRELKGLEERLKKYSSDKRLELNQLRDELWQSLFTCHVRPERSVIGRLFARLHAVYEGVLAVVTHFYLRKTLLELIGLFLVPPVKAWASLDRCCMNTPPAVILQCHMFAYIENKSFPILDDLLLRLDQLANEPGLASNEMIIENPLGFKATIVVKDVSDDLTNFFDRVTQGYFNVKDEGWSRDAAYSRAYGFEAIDDICFGCTISVYGEGAAKYTKHGEFLMPYRYHGLIYFPSAMQLRTDIASLIEPSAQGGSMVSDNASAIYDFSTSLRLPGGLTEEFEEVCKSLEWDSLTLRTVIALLELYLGRPEDRETPSFITQALKCIQIPSSHAEQLIIAVVSTVPIFQKHGLFDADSFLIVFSLLVFCMFPQLSSSLCSNAIHYKLGGKADKSINYKMLGVFIGYFQYRLNTH